MDYNIWGNDYINQSDKIKKYIEKLKLNMDDLDIIEQRETKRRIALLYEISYEMKCTAKRLKGGNCNEYNLFS